MRKTIATAAALLMLISARAPAQSTAFTYQGELKQGTTLANGPHDLRFRLFDTSSGGTAVGSQVCVDNASLADGKFTTTIDFGQQFASIAPRFLEIEVRQDTGQTCANTAGYTVLSPRQILAPAPRATAATTANALTIPNGSSVLVNLTNDGRVGIGTASPASQLHLYGVQDAFKISGLQPYMTLVDTNAANARVLLQNEGGRYFVVSEDALDGTNPGAFTMVDRHGRLSLGNYAPTGPFEVWVTGGLPGLVTTYSGSVGVGTNTPTAKLDVRGNVKLGTTGQYFAPAGEENLRIIRATTNGSGSILAGAGMTVVLDAPGRYTVTFTTPFAALPTVTLTPISPSLTNEYATWAQVVTINSSSFTMEVSNFTGGFANRAVNIIAVGPR